MPQAVMHVLLAIIALDLFRDYIVKNKKKPGKFSLSKKYLANPKKLVASMIYIKWLNVLTEKMPLEQLEKFKD